MILIEIVDREVAIGATREERAIQREEPQVNLHSKQLCVPFRIFLRTARSVCSLGILLTTPSTDAMRHQI
jgi:hypothetical protein